jgi:hypothetical protein
MSPIVWQPVAGWQTNTPVGPHGAHERLQQAPPHEGMAASVVMTAPPSVIAVPPQSIPSTSPQLAGPPGGASAQVPTVLPEGTLQMPAQQSAPAAQMSPPCPHHDEGWHVPEAHRPEQHAAPLVHELPSVVHVDEIEAHVPPVQVCEQHCPSVLQASPTVAHAG